MSEQETIEPEFVRPSAACQKFGMTMSTLYRWIRAGDLTAHKRGTATFLEAAAIRALITGKDQPK